jgi:hypothetical protein
MEIGSAHARQVQLVIACLLAGFLVLGLLLHGPNAGVMLFSALMFGIALVASFAGRVRLVADGKGLRGKLGFSAIDLSWKDIERIDVVPRAPALILGLQEGKRMKIIVPNLPIEDVVDRMNFWKRGGVERVIDVPPPRYPIPTGVETYLALEKKDDQLLCVNVLVGGAKIEDVAKAARVLAVRAADENRWDASFSGKIRLLLSSLRTPISEKLKPLMDAAIAGAREDLQKKGWTVVGGTPFSLSWEVTGLSERS